ncbi:hypothetical protein DM02DRAFT_322852 [Periconia macrospinosa]|uniref:Uncharacterized protein n=1 Tax=Periconia macrospinosa TaxID=97972 RepID=A0A2V1EB01_9PLEO|nr:hypothetical protein DM02DRAFT_322852 [Periconia macrospinosa]
MPRAINHKSNNKMQRKSPSPAQWITSPRSARRVPQVKKAWYYLASYGLLFPKQWYPSLPGRRRVRVACRNQPPLSPRLADRCRSLFALPSILLWSVWGWKVSSQTPGTCRYNSYSSKSSKNLASKNMRRRSRCLHSSTVWLIPRPIHIIHP